MNSLPQKSSPKKAANQLPLYAFDTLTLYKRFGAKEKIDTSKLTPRKGKQVFKKDFLYVTYRRNYAAYIQEVTVTCQSMTGLLYGNNLFNFEDYADINRALNMISERVSNLLSIEYDAHGATVTALDIQRDFFVGQLLPFYLDAIGRHEIARTERKHYPENSPFFVETVEFSNAGRNIQFYDKRAHLDSKRRELPEVKRALASGILRLEVGIEKHALDRDLKARFNSTEKKAGEILTPEFAAYVIDRTLSEIGLDAEIPTLAEHKEEIRARIKKPQTAARLINFIELIDREGVMKAKEKYKGDFKHRKKQLADAGLWRMFFASQTLPALSSFLNDDWTIYS
ncbi:MAG TPA: phage/plasmid replication protein [Pyrinomonadaceae bacterium]|jgi:hypothetical protein